MLIYLEQKKWQWAKDRITAGFMLDLSMEDLPFRYALFFHGDDETHSLYGASIGVVFFDELDISYFTKTSEGFPWTRKEEI